MNQSLYYRSRLPLHKPDIRMAMFGTSTVQQKNSIFDFIARECSRRHLASGFESRSYGYGGMTIEVAPCYVERVLEFKPDIVILDWWDSTILVSDSEMKFLFESLIYHFHENSIAVIAYFHYRKDQDEIRSRQHQYVDVLCQKYDVSSYFDVFNDYLLDTAEMFRDVVHTTQKGSEVLAGRFCEDILKAYYGDKKIQEQYALPSLNRYRDVRYRSITSEMIDGEFMIVDGYFVLGESCMLRLDIRDTEEIMGFVMKIGPYSSYADVMFDNKIESKYELLIWDDWCHYERETTCLKVNCMGHEDLVMRSSDKSVDYSTCKRMFDGTGLDKLLKIKGLFFV